MRDTLVEVPAEIDGVDSQKESVALGDESRMKNTVLPVPNGDGRRINETEYFNDTRWDWSRC